MHDILPSTLGQLSDHHAKQVIREMFVQVPEVAAVIPEIAAVIPETTAVPLLK